MLTTTFNKETQLNIELPQASSEKAESNLMTEIEVSVNESGQFFVNSKPLVNTQRDSLVRSIRSCEYF